MKLEVRDFILIDLTFCSSLSSSCRDNGLPVDPLGGFNDIRGDTALTCSTIGLGSVGAFQAIIFQLGR